MKSRKLTITIWVDATKTRCGGCGLQHPEVHGCMLFGRLEPIYEDGKFVGYHRRRRCRIVESKTRQGKVFE